MSKDNINWPYYRDLGRRLTGSELTTSAIVELNRMLGQVNPSGADSVAPNLLISDSDLTTAGLKVLEEAEKQSSVVSHSVHEQIFNLLKQIPYNSRGSQKQKATASRLNQLKKELSNPDY